MRGYKDPWKCVQKKYRAMAPSSFQSPAVSQRLALGTAPRKPPVWPSMQHNTYHNTELNTDNDVIKKLLILETYFLLSFFTVSFYCIFLWSCWSHLPSYCPLFGLKQSDSGSSLQETNFWSGIGVVSDPPPICQFVGKWYRRLISTVGLCADFLGGTARIC